MSENFKISVRLANLKDATDLCRILNAIIQIGGTTAHQKTLAESEFADRFLQGDGLVCCHVAHDERGAAAGFQALHRHKKQWDNWADIATFARIEPKVSGIGTALFSRTLAYARTVGITVIDATIRADNVSGLAYYGKMGFQSYQVDEAIPLRDGTPVDRISKKFEL